MSKLTRFLIAGILLKNLAEKLPQPRMDQPPSLGSRQLAMITNDILVEILHRRRRRRSTRSGSSDVNQLGGIVHSLFIIRVLNDAVVFEDDFFVVTKARASFNQLVVVESGRGEVFLEASRS